MRSICMYASMFCLSLVSLHGEIKDKTILQEKAKNIKLIALDVDGVLTNGDITFSASGDELKTFNAKDGYGLLLANKHGLLTAIITFRESSIVKRRADELKVSMVFQNSKIKSEALEAICEKYGLQHNEICYMGDDLPDLPVLKAVGLSCCPCDAMPEVLGACDFIATRKGGRGAVREMIDLVLYNKNIE